MNNKQNTLSISEKIEKLKIKIEDLKRENEYLIKDLKQKGVKYIEI